MNRTVLIVEDDADIAASMQRCLEEEGYGVATAGNGQDALRELTRTRPCLILLDLLMPVMNGFEFLEHLRGQPEHANIPVLVVSAASTVEPPPGLPLLRKPFTLSAFMSAVQQHAAA